MISDIPESDSELVTPSKLDIEDVKTCTSLRGSVVDQPIKVTRSL